MFFNLLFLMFSHMKKYGEKTILSIKCECGNYIASFLQTAKFFRSSFCPSLRQESYISFNCNLSPSFSLKLTQNSTITLIFLSLSVLPSQTTCLLCETI